MIDNSKEYIACSAIHYDNGIKYTFMSGYGVKSGFVLGGLRHPFIMSVLSSNPYSVNIPERLKYLDNELEWGKDLPRHEVTQGFITSYGRFVDRKEAMKIALDCGQVKKEELGNERIGLFSEDIFPHQELYAE